MVSDAFMKDVIQFFSEVRIELSKVVWPKLNEWIGSTVIVLVIVGAFAIYLGAIDLVFSRLARSLFEYYGLQ